MCMHFIGGALKLKLGQNNQFAKCEKSLQLKSLQTTTLI